MSHRTISIKDFSEGTPDTREGAVSYTINMGDVTPDPVTGSCSIELTQPTA